MYMDKETHEALKGIIDRLRSSANMEEDNIELVAGWIEEVATEYAA
jgi:hypothetical protein